MKNNQKSTVKSDKEITFIHYTKALQQLKKRLSATPDELAMWIWMGQELEGLNAYIIHNEKSLPESFYYTDTGDGADYLTPLLACSFKLDDITNFKPTKRYITGKALIQRWKKFKDFEDTNLKSFIQTKINEEKLYSYNPITGLTSEHSTTNGVLPSFKKGIFSISQIIEIEKNELTISDSSEIIERNFIPSNIEATEETDGPTKSTPKKITKQAQRQSLDIYGWKKAAKDLAKTYLTENPEITVVGLSKKIHKQFQKDKITGRGGRIPSEENIKRNALIGIKQ